MVDFARLVHGAARAVFGEPVTITPLASQPGAPAFVTRLVFDERAVELASEMGTHLAREPVLMGPRAAFPVEPRAGDRAALRGVTYQVQTPEPDGEGGLVLPLKRV